MIPVYNESDIIESVVLHLISQGIQLVILDNGSTDGSYESCSKFLGRGVSSLERLATDRLDFDLLIAKLYEMALKERPDWVLLSAADEFLESPYSHLSLQDAIESENQKGYNMVQFNNFEFWPTEKDENSHESDVRKRLKYYTFNDDLQFRAWKTCPGITVTGTAGHYPVFPDKVRVQIPRTKYILRHYRIRSYQHGLKKVFSERLPRYSSEERRKGRHVHYDNFMQEKRFFIINSANLNKYNDDGKWIAKKTFDWTWGLKAKPWAKPPGSHLTIRLANKVPVAAELWKILFLKRKPLPTQDEKS
ncbi:MAG TPA: glycosyltransferase family 2 protein [Terriglobales bacterium]|nr:glycosyltransferase family 2 protein [Terriglobales bacterium]